MRFSSPIIRPGQGAERFVREAFRNHGIGKSLLAAGRQSKKGVTEYTGKHAALQQLTEKVL